jgi:hypothetical protein
MENSRKFGDANIKKVIPIPSAGHFFGKWLEVIQPLHHLTDREMDLLAEFLKRRYQLQRTILDKDMIDSVLMSGRSKKAIREACGISDVYYQKIMVAFREKGVIIPDSNIRGGKINPMMIPPLDEEDKILGVLFVFNNPNDGQ